MSTSEAEFILLEYIVPDAVWVRAALTDFVLDQYQPTLLNQDNFGTI